MSPELARLEPLLDNLDKLSPDHARKLHGLVQKYQGLQVQKDGQEQYLKFVETVWPSFIEGKHHKLAIRNQNLRRMFSPRGFWGASQRRRLSRLHIPQSLLWGLVVRLETW